MMKKAKEKRRTNGEIKKLTKKFKYDITQIIKYGRKKYDRTRKCFITLLYKKT